MCEARFALLNIAKPGAISPPPPSRPARAQTAARMGAQFHGSRSAILLAG